METNEFEVIVNGSLEHAVTVHEQVITRDAKGAISKARYSVYYRGEEQDVYDNCGDALTHAVEIGLESTSK